MKFVCDRCQTKYSIADDKVRGKVLKVRCKTCQNVITVREPGARPSVGSLAPVRPSQKPSTGPVATLGETHDELSERTAIAAVPAAFMAELAQQQPRKATPPPPPPVGDGIEWFLALEGAQQGPFTRKALVDRLLTLPKDADIHVWNDQMDGWKAPKDVPDVAHDLAARRPPAVPTRPPVPRLTPSPPLPPTSAVPPPTARRGTMPLTSGVGSKLPAPVAATAHAHAVPAPHAAAADPVAAQQTPAPAARTRKPSNGIHTNGTAAHAAAAAPAAAALAVESDPLSALDLGNVAVGNVAVVQAGAPRLMEMSEATSWAGAGRVSEGRHKSTKMAVGLLAVVGVIIVVATLNMTKKSPTVTASTAKAALDSEALGKMAADLHKEEAVQPPIAPSGPTGPSTSGPSKLPHGRPAPHTRPGARGGNGGGTTLAGTAPSAPSAPSAPVMPERAINPIASTRPHRPPPSQGDISRVINNNKIGIKTCYQRALLRDSSLTHGKIVVGLTIGISGRVKGTKVDGPSSFRTLEPCIREMVGRWTFPQADEEYGTEFSYVFQGNE